MTGVNDYIKSPHKAVEAGYSPCYLTKVSAVINRGFSRAAWGKHMPELSLDDSVRDYARSAFLHAVAIAIVASLPVTAWLIAPFMPGGKGD